MPFITAENSKALSALAIQARQLKREQAQHDLDAAREVLKALTPMNATPLVVQETYLAERLVRVRKQITSLERRIEDLLEGDPSENASAIDRLCAAKAKLSEEERILAGRPLPGSHRPRQTSGPRRPSSADPLAE